MALFHLGESDSYTHERPNIRHTPQSLKGFTLVNDVNPNLLPDPRKSSWHHLAPIHAQVPGILLTQTAGFQIGESDGADSKRGAPGATLYV